jgi:hypothetical protein
MKAIVWLWLIMTYCKTVGYAVANKTADEPNENNVFLITLDGFRWQELFSGADSTLINDPDFTKAPAIVKDFFWAQNPGERRKKLMPFLWSVIAKEGQLLGNRFYNNKVNVSNIYALSYPGYNEIFTGNTDPFIFSNNKIKNRNSSVFEYLNGEHFFQGEVASFTSWSLFPYILNESRSKLYINSQNKLFDGNFASSLMKDDDNNYLRSDFETYQAAKKYIVANHPRVVHIGLSGTETYAHKQEYDHYLYQAHLADKIIAGLWHLVQASPFYRDNTSFIITTDHGRGASSKTWYTHGFLINGSSQTWVALLGNSIKKMGESHQQVQLYQKQVAGTIGYLLNIKSYNNYCFPINLFNPIK